MSNTNFPGQTTRNISVLLEIGNVQGQWQSINKGNVQGQWQSINSVITIIGKLRTQTNFNPQIKTTKYQGFQTRWERSM